VRDALVGTGTIALLDARVEELRARAREVLDSVGTRTRGRSLFDAIDEYNARREV
jgi:hypothetical protein